MKLTFLPYALAAYVLAMPLPAAARDYTVKYSGSRLEDVAKRSRVSVPEILACNPNLRRNIRLRSDQRLHVAEEYVVRSGDTVGQIAYRHGVTLAEIVGYNALKDADEIAPGITLEFPCRTRPQTKKPTEDGDEDHVPAPSKKKSRSSRRIRFPSGMELKVVSRPDLTGFQREFYDPNNSGNPLLEIPKHALYRQVSSNFVLGEFAQIVDLSFANRDYVQWINGDPYYKYIRLDPDLVRKLEKLRAAVKQSIPITSGYRSYGYNARLYKKLYHRRPTVSRHSSGDGVDVGLGYGRVRKSVERTFARGGVGRGSGFTHVDDRGRKARWSY